MPVSIFKIVVADEWQTRSFNRVYNGWSLCFAWFEVSYRRYKK